MKRKLVEYSWIFDASVTEYVADNLHKNFGKEEHETELYGVAVLFNTDQDFFEISITDSTASYSKNVEQEIN